MKKLIGMLLGVLLLTACGSTPQSSSASQPQQSSSSASSGLDLSNIPLPGTSSQSTADSSVSQPTTFMLTVPEGCTLARIGMTLEEKGICTAAQFIEAAQAGDYAGYSLIAAQTPSEQRCFALEGYLFPDTYEFYLDAAPGDIVRTLLNNTETRIDAALRAEIAQSGYTIDEVITMASIIEKESFGSDIMPLVSSVIHNRLDTGMQLQMDVTIVYVEGAIKPFITGDIDRYNSHYNTYKCSGLPAGAICNPGLEAIGAALAPADTDYLYFVTDSEKNYYFAETYEQHQENCKLAGV